MKSQTVERMSGAYYPKRLQAILDKTGGHCAYCGVVLQPAHTRRKDRISIDHIQPRSRGGKNGIENLVPACVHCNYSKHSKPLEEWRQILVRRTYGEFTENHIAHLKSLGMTLPEGFPCYPPHLFWFEEQGLRLA